MASDRPGPIWTRKVNQLCCRYGHLVFRPPEGTLVDVVSMTADFWVACAACPDVSRFFAQVRDRSGRDIWVRCYAASHESYLALRETPARSASEFFYRLQDPTGRSYNPSYADQLPVPEHVV